MDAAVHIKLILPGELMRDVKTAVAQQGMFQVEFFIEAAKNELIRMQESKIREDISIIEINNDILAEGESLNIIADEGKSGPESLFEHCEMCHDLLTAPAQEVSGPFFCNRCMGIAKGADFRGLES